LGPRDIYIDRVLLEGAESERRRRRRKKKKTKKYKMSLI
jgi:hypothetical protein